MVRCANLVLEILRYLQEYSVPIWHFRTGRPVRFRHLFCFFPVGWKRQPEEGGIGPGCCGGGVITTWAAGDGVLVVSPDGVPARTGATFLWRPSIHPPLKLPTASTPGPMPPSSGVPLYIRPTNSRQHPPSDRCFLCPSIHPPHESTSPSRTRSVRLSPPLRYQSSTKESKELTGILPIIIWINAFFSSKRKV